MKKTIKYILIIVLLILGVSCNDYLDYQEEDFYTEDEIFSVYSRVSDVLTNLYGKLELFNDIDNSMRESATDDAEETLEQSEIQIMNDGRWSSIRTIDTKWLEMFEGIRSANQLLMNYDMKLLDNWRYNNDYDNIVKNYEIVDEQARFLRAYMYFELIRRYGGGIPLLKDKILELDEVNNVPVNSFDEIKNFIVNECDDIVEKLPVNYNSYSGDQKGRITKGAVMALKARTLTYSASPLFNSSSWEDAAKASWTLIDSSMTKGWYTLDNKYTDVVNNSKSKELILGRRISASNNFESINFPMGYEGANLRGTNPTQNLVNTYRMLNGKTINDPESGFDPNNPYQNRDPRLNSTIITNNSSWKGRKVELWRGGRDGRPLEGASKTGYYLKKYMVESVSLDPDFLTTANHLNVIFRFGEVLLNYAEAMNEAYGPNDAAGFGMTAYDAVNMIRNRAGMPDFKAGMTKDEFREELRAERRVELAFENHRFWDIRRWKIGDQTKQINGIDITKNQEGSLSYSEFIVETRGWDPKMNFYPIPQSELFKNANLKQNTGW